MGVHFKENEEKITLGMIIVSIFIIGILTSGLIVYFLNMNKDVNQEHILGEVEQKNNDDDFEEVSIEMGKTVNESQNELNVKTEDLVDNDTENSFKTNITNDTKAENSEIKTSSNVSEKNIGKKNELEEVKETNNLVADKKEEKEVSFEAPIKGKILREFALDSLVYSDTLEEWITHTGIDISASKSSVVKASAKGKVYAIKNDPRYGVTVIINHDNNFQTVYANLLTAEFVVQGEDVELGQTIGTIGNSATFEIADDYHLHFELLKDGNYINPEDYMDF